MNPLAYEMGVLLNETCYHSQFYLNSLHDKSYVSLIGPMIIHSPTTKPCKIQIDALYNTSIDHDNFRST